MPDRDASPSPPPGVDNRRNYYRVLHVQPEAPVEVIKASYRTLMTQLKVHPDLGGSHAQAAMINEAWAVLGDPERRAAYDRLLRRRGPPSPRQGPAAAGDGFQPMGPGMRPAASAGAAAQAARGTAPASEPPTAPRPGAPDAASADAASPPSPPAGERAAGPAPETTAGTAADPTAAGAAGATAEPPAAAGRGLVTPADEAPASAEEAPGRWQREHACALCGQAAAPDPRPDARCLRCHAPLAALPLPGSPGHELLGRRGAIRRAQGHVAVLRIGWPSPELPVRWRDLSLTGLSVFTPQPIAPGQRIHLADQALEAVAEVVACRPQGRLYTVHARLVTALLLQSTGVFMSAEA